MYGDLQADLVTLSCASCGVDPTAWQTEVGVVFKVTRLSISPLFPCRRDATTCRVNPSNIEINNEPVESRKNRLRNS